MNKIKVKCGIPHKHNYADCCAACTHGGYPAEGASGHVKTCKRYKPMTQLDTKQKIELTLRSFAERLEKCNLEGVPMGAKRYYKFVDQLYSLYQEGQTTPQFTEEELDAMAEDYEGLARVTMVMNRQVTGTPPMELMEQFSKHDKLIMQIYDKLKPRLAELLSTLKKVT
jgi:hypothetical protein